MKPLSQESHLKFLTFLTIVLSAYWLIFHHETLNYYWNWDDFHLLRLYSTDEMLRAFQGSWDLENLETAGYRPLSVLFNGFRFFLLGESPGLHRLFLLGMAASTVGMLGWIGLRLNLTRWEVGVALLILVSTKVFSGDIIWVSDGLHVFQSWLLAAATVAMLIFSRGYKPYWGGMSLCFISAALLTREDSLIGIMILPVIFLVNHWSGSPVAPTFPEIRNALKKLDRRAYVFFVALVSSAFLLFALRFSLVPSAKVQHASFWGIFCNFKTSALITGEPITKSNLGWGFQNGSALLDNITNAWKLILLCLFAFQAFICRKKSRASKAIIICYLCMLLACLPGFVFTRANVIFWPTFFFTLIVSLSVAELWKIASENAIFDKLRLRILQHEYNLLHLCVLFVIIVSTAGSMTRAVMQFSDLHPLSINQLVRDLDFSYSGAMPEKRREYIVKKFASLGIDYANVSEQTFADLVSNAQKDDLYFSKRNSGKIFIPPALYLTP